MTPNIFKIEKVPFDVEVSLAAPHLNQGYDEISKKLLNFFNDSRWRSGKTMNGHIWARRTDGVQITLGGNIPVGPMRGNMNPRAIIENIERQDRKAKVSGYVGFTTLQAIGIYFLFANVFAIAVAILANPILKSLNGGSYVLIPMAEGSTLLGMDPAGPMPWILLAAVFMGAPYGIKLVLENEIRRTVQVLPALIAAALEAEN